MIHDCNSRSFEVGHLCLACANAGITTILTQEGWISTQGSILLDANTNDVVDGVELTAELVLASAEAPGGIILIDKDGDVAPTGSWNAQQPGVRQVYASVIG